jgi:hyperpolarization activated cyclic nucleotide-gated potassium channel 1
MDLLAAVPFSVIDLANHDNHDDELTQGTDWLKLAKVSRLYRIARIFRLFKIGKIFRQSETIMNLIDMMHLNAMIMKMLKLLIPVILSVHLMGCLFYFNSSLIEDSNQTWIYKGGFID